ncbi:MAG TPA: hypothetical protein VFE62_03815 [Gemmataceae bacterium]|nr:hypothetical protein [Gemmataceae bacterium]
MSRNVPGNRSRRGADEIIIAALACGSTVQQAADTAGVSRKTVSRRMAEPEFAKRVAEMRSEMVRRTASKMTDGMLEAAEVLRKLLKAKGENVRLGACRALFEHGVRIRETVELEERLQALEQRAKAGEQK